MSLAALGAALAAVSLTPPDLSFRAMPYALAVISRLSILLLLLCGGSFLLWCAIQVIKYGVVESRWSESRLDFWRHYFHLTDWPIFYASLVIWGLWPHSYVFWPAFALIRTHTLIMNALKDPDTRSESSAIPNGVWGRWESTKPVVSNYWGKRTSNI